MNREQKIKAVEKILKQNFDSFFHQVYFYIKIQKWYDNGIRKTATAIVDSLEVDIKEIRNIIFDNTYVDKGGFSGQYEVAGISKTVREITTDIIKIKE